MNTTGTNGNPLWRNQFHTQVDQPEVRADVNLKNRQGVQNIDTLGKVAK
jgi:hypothetical protein